MSSTNNQAIKQFLMQYEKKRRETIQEKSMMNKLLELLINRISNLAELNHIGA